MSCLITYFDVHCFKLFKKIEKTYTESFLKYFQLFIFHLNFDFTSLNLNFFSSSSEELNGDFANRLSTAQAKFVTIETELTKKVNMMFEKAMSGLEYNYTKKIANPPQLSTNTGDTKPLDPSGKYFFLQWILYT